MWEGQKLQQQAMAKAAAASLAMRGANKGKQMVEDEDTQKQPQAQARGSGGLFDDEPPKPITRLQVRAAYMLACLCMCIVSSIVSEYMCIMDSGFAVIVFAYGAHARCLRCTSRRRRTNSKGVGSSPDLESLLCQ